VRISNFFITFGTKIAKSFISLLLKIKLKKIKMKKLLVLLAVSLSFTFVNAQETTKSSTPAKAECAHGKTEAKSCDKSAPASGKACCDKSSATSTEAKSCCDKSKSGATSCAGSSSAYSKTVSAKDFMSYADRFPSENIVDIRTKTEAKEGMIAGAKNIDYNSRDFKENINKLDKDAAIMIYCNNGKNSAEAVNLLKSWGFTKIYNMDGGYKAYVAQFPAKK